jgi:hypothetical protein
MEVGSVFHLVRVAKFTSVTPQFAATDGPPTTGYVDVTDHRRPIAWKLTDDGLRGADGPPTTGYVDVTDHRRHDTNRRGDLPANSLSAHT